LRQRRRATGPINVRSGCHPAAKVSGVTFDDRHLLEGIAQHSGGEHASHSTTKNHRLPAPILRHLGS
jgi:hypothetical protein